MRLIQSDSVRYGRNAELTTWDDARYVRCKYCGYICHLDRDLRVPFDSRLGDGTVHPSTQLNGAVTANDTTITVDDASDFATPATGSITAFASAGRAGTTVTSASHGLNGGKVTITGTTSYNGTFYIDNVVTDSFTIRATFVADDATGTWTIPEYIYIHDAGSYATVADADSTYTDATNAPAVNGVSYTAKTATTFTGCSGATAHDDNMVVKGEMVDQSGCPQCGSLTFDKEL
jgi:hypothetical protein